MQTLSQLNLCALHSFFFFFFMAGEVRSTFIAKTSQFCPAAQIHFSKWKPSAGNIRLLLLHASHPLVAWRLNGRSALGACSVFSLLVVAMAMGQSSALLDGRAGSGLRGGAHRAVASQLSPRRTWRHLVPVSTVLTDATEGGSGLQGSAPEAEEEAADAREQEVWGGAVPTNANSLVSAFMHLS